MKIEKILDTNLKEKIRKFFDEKRDEIFSAEELQNIYGDETLDVSKLFRWFNKNSGYTIKHKSKRLRFFGCPEAIEKVKEILKQDWEE